MKLKNLYINDNPLFLAPMAGVNCAAFRLLCKDFGADVVSTPMINTNSFIGTKARMLKQLNFLKEEKPISAQVIGKENIPETVNILNEYADIIDLNLGCPEKEMLSQKVGGFYSKHPEQIPKILNQIISNTNKPVTVKIRCGWDEKSVNTLKTFKILKDFDISAITLHPRTVKQGYSGAADWSQIKLLKENSDDIPIIGNGDIFKSGTGKVMLDQTKCDGLMVGRGSMGDPRLFSELKYLITHRKNLGNHSENNRIIDFLKFSEYYSKFDKNRSFSEFRQQALWFTKRTTFVDTFKHKILRCQNFNEIIEIFERNKNN